MKMLVMFVALRNRMREKKPTFQDKKEPGWHLDKNSFVFISPNGNKYSKIILRHLNNIMLQAGVIPEGTKINPYSFRNFFTTHMNYHQDPRVAKHALRQAGHGGSKKDDEKTFLNNYDRNQADNAKYIQTVINAELQNDNLEIVLKESELIEEDRQKLKKDMQMKIADQTNNTCDLYGDLLGPNNPVGAKVQTKRSKKY